MDKVKQVHTLSHRKLSMFRIEVTKNKKIKWCALKKGACANEKLLSCIVLNTHTCRDHSTLPHLPVPPQQND